MEVAYIWFVEMCFADPLHILDLSDMHIHTLGGESGTLSEFLSE